MAPGRIAVGIAPAAWEQVMADKWESLATIALVSMFVWLLFLPL
jgi:sensor histidine kinase regulating citrate/malate metabolism